MQPKVVALSVVAVMLLAGCDATPEATKTLDPSGLGLRLEAINYQTNEKDVSWPGTDVSPETNPCNGDVVTLQGSSHFVMHTGFDNLGGMHYTANIVSKGTGVAAVTGRIYKINEHFKDAEQVPGQYTSYVIRTQDTWDVDGPTAADSYKRITTLKITVTSQGMPTPTIDESTTTCGH